MAITAFCEKDGLISSISPQNIEQFIHSSALIWLDFEAPLKQELEIAKKLAVLHPLTIKDIFSENKRPKVQEFDDYLFLVVHATSFESGKTVHSELDIVLGKNFLISFHSKPVKNISMLQHDLQKDPQLFKRGPSYLLYYLLESIVEEMFHTVDSLNELIDLVESEIFSSKHNQKILNKLFKLKRNVVSFRRVVSPQRDVLNFLYHHDNGFVDKERSIYFRDLADNLVRVSEFIDTERDMISDAFEAYLSVVSNRLNEIMKVLTIIATIILPMSLVAGFYGMNVEFLEYSAFGKTGTYFFALFLMLVIAATMLYWFRKKQWI